MLKEVYFSEQDINEIKEFMRVKNMHTDITDYYFDSKSRARIDNLDDAITYILNIVGKCFIKKETDKYEFIINDIADTLIYHYEKEHNLNERRHQC